MQLPSAATSADKKWPSGLLLKPTLGHEMEDLQSYAEMVNRRVEVKALECQRSWEDYVRSFANYTSVVRINGKPLLPPVMCPDRRQAMRACRDRLASGANQNGNGKGDAVAREVSASRHLDMDLHDRSVRAADTSVALPLSFPFRGHQEHKQFNASNVPLPTPPPAESRQRLGGAEGAERSNPQLLRRSTGIRRSSSCGQLYRKLSSASGGMSAIGSASGVQLTADSKCTSAAPLPAVFGESAASPAVAPEILPARHRPPSPTLGSGAQVATSAAVSRNRLAVRYMSAGGLVGPAASLRQPFFSPVGFSTVQPKGQPHLDVGNGTGRCDGGSNFSNPKSLLDRVALNSSFDDGEAEMTCVKDATAVLDSAKDACFRRVAVCAAAATDGSESANHPGERRAADGREASSAAAAADSGNRGQSGSGRFCNRLATDTAGDAVPMESADATGVEQQSLEDGSSADEVLSEASSTATITTDTNLPSHLLCSASTTDTLATSTATLTHLGDEQPVCGSSCCCCGCGCGTGDVASSCEDRLACVACPATGNECRAEPGGIDTAVDSLAAAADVQSPPRLLRSNSYTLQNPSPALLRAQLSSKDLPTIGATSIAAAQPPAVESSRLQRLDANDNLRDALHRAPLDGGIEAEAASSEHPDKLSATTVFVSTAVPAIAVQISSPGKSSGPIAAVCGSSAARRTVHRRLAFEVRRQAQQQQQQTGSSLIGVAVSANGTANHSSSAIPAADVGADIALDSALISDHVALCIPVGPAAPAATLGLDCSSHRKVETEMTSCVEKEDDERKDDEEEAGAVQRSLVLLKSRVHERLLMRMRNGEPLERPNTAVPLSGDRATARALSDGRVLPPPQPARPSTSDGVIGRHYRDSVTADVACFDSPPAAAAPAAAAGGLTLECSQWLTFPESNGCLEQVGPAEPMSEVVRNDRAPQVVVCTVDRDWRATLAACVRGHLTRRLLETEKVKFLRKAVQDCRQLLANLQDVRSHPASARSSIVMDANLRDRIATQLASARGQIHDLFFVAPAQKRMSLIRQHRILEAERKLNALVRATSADSRRHRVSAASSAKVVEKLVGQERCVSSRAKSSAVPRRSASPKKTSLLSVGRVAKTIHRRSPVRRSGDGVRKRLDGQEYLNGN